MWKKGCFFVHQICKSIFVLSSDYEGDANALTGIDGTRTIVYCKRIVHVGTEGND